MIYLPIVFICLTGDLCDFVHAKPVPSKEVCETMNANYEHWLNSLDDVVAFKSACVPVERATDHGPRAKI